MKTTKKILKLSSLIAIAITGATISTQAAVVYQSDFTGADLASAGLASAASGTGGLWSLNTTDDQAQFSSSSSNSRTSLYTTGSGWQSTDGFTLDVTFNQILTGTRFSFGIVDADWTVSATFDWLNQGRTGAYGIGFATTGEMASVGGGGDALAFNNGSGTGGSTAGSSVLSTGQGNITFNTPLTLSLTVTGTGYSYSLNGATATTGSMTFDTSKNYRFIAFAQRGTTSLDGSYFSDITLTAIPEPSTYALLAGCFALTSIMVRRRR
jgi:hypothetical protein